jgi:hypothetical protein
MESVHVRAEHNPLNLVDPSGFDPGDVVGQDGKVYARIPDLVVTPGPVVQMALYLAGGAPPAPAPLPEGVKNGAGTPPNEGAQRRARCTR